MIRNSLRTLILVLLMPAATGICQAQDKITFDEHVSPIFRQHCVSCHDPNGKLGGLDLSTYQNTMSGGSSGTVIEPGSAGDSYLFMLVNHDSEPKMPKDAEKLAAADLDIIRKWIDGGVLENAGSKANLSKKPKMNLAAGGSGTARPEVVAWPQPLPLQPRVVTSRATAVTAMATSPWAPLVAIGSEEQVLLYDTRSLELVGVLPFPQGIPRVLKFSRNGSLLLAGGGKDAARGVVVVWSVETGQQIIEVGDELDTVLAADITSDHKLIALGGPQRMVRIYSTEDGSLQQEIKKHTDWVTEIAFSPDGVLLATGDRNGGLHVWETHSARPFSELRGHTAMITGLSWRGDSNILASSSEDATVRLWEMENGTQVKQWGAHGGGAADVEFLRDGRLVSCGRDRVVKLWDQNGGQQRQFEGFGDLALAATYCNETNRLIGGDWTGEVRVWNGEDGAPLGMLPANPPALETQLATAQTTLTQAQAAGESTRAAATAAKAAAEEKQAQLTAMQKQMTDAQAARQTAEAAIAAIQQSQQALTTKRDEQTAELAKRNAALPPLREAAAKAAEAATASAGDVALAKIAEDLKAKFTSYQQERDTLAAAVNETQAALTAAQTDLQTQAAAVEAAKQSLATATAEAARLEPEAKAAAEAMRTAAAAQAQTDAALAKATADVEHWQQAIVFQQAWDKISQEINQAEETSLAAQGKWIDAEQAVTDAQAEVDKIAQAAAAAQQAIATADDETAKANGVIEAATAEIATHTKALEGWNVNKSGLDQAIAELQQSLTHAQAAAGGNADENLAAAIKSLETAIATRTEQITQLAAQITAAQTAMQEAMGRTAAAREVIAHAQDRKQSATAQIAALGEQQQAAATKFTATQTAAAEAKTAAEAADKAVEAARARITALRQATAAPQGEED